jgi:hypothetical protein
VNAERQARGENMRRAVCLFSLFIAVAMMSQESVNNMISLADFTNSRGRRLVWEVTGDTAKATPRWDSEKDTLPLPVTDAIAIAKKWARSRCRNCEVLAIEEIRISPIPVPDFQDRWYYTVFLTPVVYGAHQYDNEMTVVLLFNKTVVEPKEKEQRNYE